MRYVCTHGSSIMGEGSCPPLLFAVDSLLKFTYLKIKMSCSCPYLYFVLFGEGGGHVIIGSENKKL